MKRRIKCPAPELASKRSRIIVRIAAFYKRPIDRADVREINPTFAAKKYELDQTFKRLVVKGYLEIVGDHFALTKYGHEQMMAYAWWHRETYGSAQ